MVHHAVEGVVEASLFIENIDWLNGAIPSVTVKGLKHELAEIAILTVVAVPHIETIFAVTHLASDIRSITCTGHELEASRSPWWSHSTEGRGEEAQEDILWSSAGPLAAVVDVCPPWVRVLEPDH